MSIRFISECACVVSEDLPSDKSLAAIDASIERMLDVRTTRDFLRFLDEASLETLELFGIFELSEDAAVDTFVSSEPKEIFGQNLSAVIGKCLPDAEYLDRWALGDLGEISEEEYKCNEGKSIKLETIKFTSPCRLILTNVTADKIIEIHALAKYAAIANGHEGEIEKLPSRNCVAVNDRLSWYGEIHHPVSSFRGRFDKKMREQIVEELNAHDDEIEAASYEKNAVPECIGRSPKNKIFIYPKGTTDREIALDIFAAFMNSFYANGEGIFEIENSFGVDISEGRISVYAKESSQQRFFHEFANLAADDRFAICPRCGNAFYRPTNRLNYCSDSCKTLASKDRREKTMAFAYSGKPIKQAIDAIGEEYASSIEKWYKEAQAITAQLAE